MNILLSNIAIIRNRLYSIHKIVELSTNTNERYKILNNAKLSTNANAVLNDAFNAHYDNHAHYANMYDLFNGSKGMDWWNFPWDLPSQHGHKYTITYNDMKDILENVVVKMNPLDITYVRYSTKLADVTLGLTYQIMNSHGGAPRVIKIIYCLRNFMSVAIKYKLINDINNLKPAIIHLINIPPEKLLGNRSYDAFNINGVSEKRTRDNGLAELKNILTTL